MKILMLASVPLLLLAGCTNAPVQKAEAPHGPASTKDMLPKLRAMAPYTQKLIPWIPVTGSCLQADEVGVLKSAPCGENRVGAAAPQTGTYTATWPDGAGGTYSVAVPAASWTHTPAPPPPVTGMVIPSTATSSGALEVATNWEMNHDAGTPGTSTGTRTYPAPAGSPTVPVAGSTAAAYNFTYTGKAGEIYHDSFAHNATVTHFVYDVYLYFPDVSQLQNVEMDMNQVVPNGNTDIFGTQCASGSKTWEYTTMVNGGSHWNASNIPCNPLTWTAKTWHHVQIMTERNADGSVVTYDSVCFDGACSNFTNASGLNGLNLKWAASTLLLNFQIDGNLSSGAISAYTDKLQIYYW